MGVLWTMLVLLAMIEGFGGEVEGEVAIVHSMCINKSSAGFMAGHTGG